MTSSLGHNDLRRTYSNMYLLVSRCGIGNLGKDCYEYGFYPHKIHTTVTLMATRDSQHSLFGTIPSSCLEKTVKDLSLVATTK